VFTKLDVEKLFEEKPHLRRKYRQRKKMYLGGHRTIADFDSVRSYGEGDATEVAVE
jgi:hypothetical protein